VPREANAPRDASAPREANAPRDPTRPQAIALLVAIGALCLTLAAAFLSTARPEHPRRRFNSRHTPKSVAVLPFLDLTTQEMNGEYFADGMTEELIDRLSKIPGLRVPPPTSSFYFKGKQVKVADIARSLGVAYILDGSVRKSDAMLRVARA